MEKTESLEIYLEPRTMYLLREKAQRQKVSIDRLIRRAIELMLENDRDARLQAAEALFQVEAPVADWKSMKQEITEAYIQEQVD